MTLTTKLKQEEHYVLQVNSEEGKYEVVNKHTGIVEAEHTTAPQAALWMEELNESYDKYVLDKGKGVTLTPVH